MSKYFVFTLNNYKQEDEIKLQNLGNDSRLQYMIFQYEKGEKGTPHIQGYICFRKKTAWNTVKKLIGKTAHIEKRKGNHNQAKEYCSKTESRQKDTQPFEFGSDELIPRKRGQRMDFKKIQKQLLEAKNNSELDKVEDENFGAFARYGRYFRDYKRRRTEKLLLEKRKEKYHNVQLYDWQKYIINKVMSQDDRKVTWVYDRVGGMGKSFLGNYLETMKDGFLIQNAKRNDIAHAYNNERLVIFDLTRSDEQFVNYSTIEQFKNGRIFSGKYESRMKRFIYCFVLVLSNFAPDEQKLSADRWDIYNLAELKVQLEKNKNSSK